MAKSVLNFSVKPPSISSKYCHNDWSKELSEDPSQVGQLVQVPSQYARLGPVPRQGTNQNQPTDAQISGTTT